MNISKQYAWRPTENYRENNPLLPQNLRGLVIGKSGCGKTTLIFTLLLQPGWLDYNHLYVFGKSHHQQEYMVLRKGLEAGLSKQQVSNLFNSQEAMGNNLLSLPLKSLALYVMERYNLTFTMIAKIFQMHHHRTYTKEFVAVGRLLSR